MGHTRGQVSDSISDKCTASKQNQSIDSTIGRAYMTVPSYRPFYLYGE